MLLVKSSKDYIGAKKIRIKSEKEVENILSYSDTEELFGERLFIIGRQLEFEDIDDKIDALAIDVEGNLVIIELKKTFYSATEADSQVCRYASYVSKWSLLDIKKTAEDYYLQKSNHKINFEKMIADFLDVDISYINQNQKIILLGSQKNRKLFSSCSWLKNLGIDIQVFQLEKYLTLTKDITLNVEKINLAAWEKNHPPRMKSKYNKEYHLKSCTRDVAELAEAFVDVINENYSYRGPIWSNQSYVKYIDKKTNKNILQFTVNKESIYVNSYYSLNGNFDKNKVKKKLQQKVGFDITNRIKF